MYDKFSSKINDLVNWSETAIIHYNKGYYADSVLNIRKSGEAVCKLLFYYRFPEKTAIQKTEGKSYKELIRAVVLNDLAERKIINWLETIQIHGNEAAHDATIEKIHAEFSMNALRLLIDWIFTQHIKTPVPEKLKISITPIPHLEKSETSNSRLQKELDKIKKEKEELQKSLESLSKIKSEESDKINQLASELKQSISHLKTLEQEKEQEKPITIKEESAIVSIADEAKTSNTKTTYRRKLFAFGIITVFAFSVLFYFFSWKGTAIARNEGSTNQSLATIDSFRVLMLPLALMQDNPNMVLKFEDALLNTIQQRIKANNIPVTVLFDRGFTKPVTTFDDAALEGIKRKTNIVLFGELYEPLSAADSVQVNVKFTMTRTQNRVAEEMGIQSFLRLTDSTATKIQLGVACFVDLTFADFMMGKGKYNEALTILYDTHPATALQQANVADLLSDCHSSRGNYSAAIKEMEKFISLQTVNKNYGYNKMANALRNYGEYKKAEEFYKKALADKPGDVNTLLNYADLLVCKEVGLFDKSKELLQQAIQYDSTSSLAWRYLADLNSMYFKNYPSAEKMYRKSISIDSNSIAKVNLAQILAFNLGEPEEAEQILLDVLSKDSTNARTLFILANIYTESNLKNPDKGEYFLTKSKKYQTTPNIYSNKYADGLVAMKKYDYKKAVQAFTEAYRIDSSDMALCNHIATCYINLMNYDSAFYFVTRGWKKDTLDYVNNANMGYFYMKADKKYADLKKSVSYFEKALKTNPYDSYSLENLAEIYFNFGNFSRAKHLLLQLYGLRPDNFSANYGLGTIYHQEGNYKEAAHYFDEAISLNPNHAELNSQYALSLINVSVTNYSLALKYAKKAVELNPNNGDNLIVLARLYIFSAKDYSHGRDYYNNAVALKPSLKDPTVEQELERLLKN